MEQFEIQKSKSQLFGALESFFGICNLRSGPSFSPGPSPLQSLTDREEKKGLIARYGYEAFSYRSFRTTERNLLFQKNNFCDVITCQRQHEIESGSENEAALPWCRMAPIAH